MSGQHFGEMLLRIAQLEDENELLRQRLGVGGASVVERPAERQETLAVQPAARPVEPVQPAAVRFRGSSVAKQVFKLLDGTTEPLQLGDVIERLPGIDSVRAGGALLYLVRRGMVERTGSRQFYSYTLVRK